MDKEKIFSAIENFANASNLLLSSQKEPVWVCHYSNWQVFYRNILLAKFEEKEDALKFADIVAKTNETEVKIYEPENK